MLTTMGNCYLNGPTLWLNLLLRRYMKADIYFILKDFLIYFKVTKSTTQSYWGNYWKPKMAKNKQKKQHMKPRPEAKALRRI